MRDIFNLRWDNRDSNNLSHFFVEKCNIKINQNLNKKLKKMFVKVLTK